MRLLRITCISLSFIFLAHFANAQSGIFIGADANYLINSIVNQNNLGQLLLDYEKPELQFAFGGHIGYKLDHRNAFKIGVIAYKGGQAYEDGFSFGRLNKTILTKHIGIPVAYRLTTGRQERDGEGAKFYFEVGPMFSIMTGGEISYARNKNEIDFLEYYTIGGRNPNTAELTQRNISKEESQDPATFIKGFDIMGYANIGVQGYITKHIMFNLGVTGVISAGDINNKEWHLNNADGEYNASRHAYAGFNLGLSYLFF